MRSASIFNSFGFCFQPAGGEGGNPNRVQLAQVSAVIPIAWARKQLGLTKVNLKHKAMIPNVRTAGPFKLCFLANLGCLWRSIQFLQFSKHESIKILNCLC